MEHPEICTSGTEIERGGALEAEVLEAVALEDCLERALAGLYPVLDALGGEVVAGTLPTVPGDPDLLGLLFDGLLGHLLDPGGWRAPLIQISARQEEGSWILAVRDNGHGADATECAAWTTSATANPGGSERFPDSARLSPAESELEGPLPVAIETCRRIVEAHRGHTWLETNHEVGTTWWMRLPG